MTDKKSEYVYSDDSDNITDILMSGTDTADWEREDNEINDRAIGLIKKLVTRKEPVLLDAGCGTGRLLPTFAPHFSHIIALEPDAERYEEAKGKLKHLGMAHKIDLRNLCVEEYRPSGRIDVVLFNHVLQHIGCNQIDTVMRTFGRIQDVGGLLLLSTCHSCTEKDYFTKARVVGSKHTEEEIGEEEFNSLTAGGQKGLLQSHFFCQKSIERILQQANYRIVDFKPYHHSIAKNGCRDQFVAAVKS